MNSHEDCIKFAEELRLNLSDAKASNDNLRKQLATANSTSQYAFDAGKKAAIRADEQIKALNEIIDELHTWIQKELGESGKGLDEIYQIMRTLPGWNESGKIGGR